MVRVTACAWRMSPSRLPELLQRDPLETRPWLGKSSIGCRHDASQAAGLPREQPQKRVAIFVDIPGARLSVDAEDPLARKGGRGARL
jgi:hypothetical protein